jgi:protein ImuB
LPIEALRLPGSTIQVLARLGVRRIEQLLVLPRAGLAARFEPDLLQRVDQLTGVQPEMIAAHRPPPEITAERELEYPINSREAICAILAELIGRISDALAARQQGAVQIECQLDCQPADCQAADARSVQRVRFIVGLFQASASPKHLLELFQMHLERLTLPGPTSAVRLAVLLAAPIPYRQRGLFADRHEEPWQLALLIDRLSSRLQREGVLRAALLPDAQPEYAYRYEPLAGSKPKRAAARRKLPQRPLFMEPQPVPLQVFSLAPQGPPMRFCFHGRQHRISQTWGPERIQTGWWRGSYIRRDYYRVQTEEGNRFWLFRRQGEWFLQGAFG